MIKTMQALINGQVINLTLEESTGDWVASVPAPQKSSYTQDGHYYPVSITATDDSNNSTTVDDTHSTLGEQLRLQVKEKVAPVITILAPTTGSYLATATPAISFKITDDDSGVDPDSVVVKVDGVALEGVVHSDIDGGYSFSVTCGALTDGAHTITVDAADHDGNAAVQAKATVTTDTVPPTLTLTSPEDGLYTNESELVVSGVTNDATSDVSVTVNGEAVTVNADGSFSTTVALTEGENVITVIATDSAGKTTTITRTVTLDTAAPVFVSVSLTPNPVDCGATYVIRVKATDD